MEERVEAVRSLLRLFRVERYLYVLLSLGAVAAIGWSAWQLMQRNSQPADLVGVFGAGGLISVGLGRLLTMWTQALQLVADQNISS